MTIIVNDTGDSGFTLVELIVSLAVFAIILLIAVPSYQDLLLNNRSTSQINDLVASLNYARSEAIKRGVDVSACSSTDGSNCNAGNNWSLGWIIGVTISPPSPPVLNPVLKIYPPLRGNARLTKNGNTTAAREVRFDRNGFAAGFNSTFMLCPEDNNVRRIRAAVVAPTGRVQLAKDDNGNGIVEGSNGADLGCPSS